jgi:hypothetical protein
MNLLPMSVRRAQRRLGPFLLTMFVLLGLPAAVGSEETVKSSKGKPGAGDPAPTFTLKGSDGKTHSLADHLGKRPVVLAWFPKAFTGG